VQRCREEHPSIDRCEARFDFLHTGEIASLDGQPRRADAVAVAIEREWRSSGVVFSARLSEPANGHNVSSWPIHLSLEQEAL
jgi:hypothetical protein